jgi:hypothetical protein
MILLMMSCVAFILCGILPGQATEPPSELIPSPSADFARVLDAPLARTYVRFATKDKEVEIARRERESSESPWSMKNQELTTSFYILHVAGRCDQELYVMGVFPPRDGDLMGESVIERWTFTHASKLDAQGTYIPLANRRLPRVDRTVVYRGIFFGHFRRIAPSPDGQFVFALTHESAQVIRFDPYSMAAEIVLSSQAVPDMSHMYTLEYRKHQVRGWLLILGMDDPWHKRDIPNGVTRTVAVFDDGDGDGDWTVATILEEADWTDQGYGPGTWVLDPCSNP